MDFRVPVLGGTPLPPEERLCNQDGKGPEIAFSAVSRMMGNERSFYVLFRNGLIQPTSMPLCSSLVPPGRTAGRVPPWRLEP